MMKVCEKSSKERVRLNFKENRKQSEDKAFYYFMVSGRTKIVRDKLIDTVDR